MTWAKLDDRFPDHPKVLRAGGDAAWLHVCAICYVAGQLTDGMIPEAMVPRLSDRKDPAKLAEVLVRVGLWERVEGGFQIHDYLEWNPSAAEVRQKRAEMQEVKSRAGKAGAAKRWQTAGKAHGRPMAAAMPPANALPMANDSPVPSRPDPDPDPNPEEKKQQRPPPAAAAASPDHAKLIEELRAHQLFAALDHRHLAGVGVGAVIDGAKIEWVVQAIRDFAAKNTGLGLSVEVLQGKLVGFMRNAKGPRRQVSVQSATVEELDAHERKMAKLRALKTPAVNQ